MSTLSCFTARSLALGASLDAAQRLRAVQLLDRMGAIRTGNATTADHEIEVCVGAREGRAISLGDLANHADAWHRAREVRGLCVPPLRRPTIAGMRLRCFGALRAEAFITAALQRSGGERVATSGPRPTHVVVGRGLDRLPATLREYRDAADVVVLSEAQLLEMIEMAVTPLALDDVQRAYLQALAFARAPVSRFAMQF